jgi:3-oxoacyl-[acyl-carrier protein] reductase
MDLGIKGRVAIVTGGSRGLGRMSALALAREGVNVAICGRTRATLDRTVDEIQSLGVSAAGIVADIAEAPSARVVYDGAVAALGPVDILVNNVGGRRGTSTVGTSDEQLVMGFEVNLFGALRLMRLAIPAMTERKWGRIINISSIYGREHGGSADYMAAKAALIASTKFAGVELIKDNVLVNSIAPGSIIHPGGTWERFSREQPPEVVQEFIARNLPAGRFGWPEPVGDLVAFLASERASMITGACIPVDAGQGRSLI